jgi:hypothetical protein
VRTRTERPLVQSSLLSYALARLLKTTAVLLLTFAGATNAQTSPSNSTNATGESTAAMQQRVSALEAEVAELKAAVQLLQTNANSPAPVTQPRVILAPMGALPASFAEAGAPSPASTEAVSFATVAPVTPQTPSTSPTQATAAAPSSSALQPDDSKLLGFFHDTTINVALDGYYDYNFNAPVGRVNLLRAYDVLSNEFSLNQADVIFDHPPMSPTAAAGVDALICNSAKPPTRCKAIPTTSRAPTFTAISSRPTALTSRRSAKASKSISENGAARWASKATTRRTR